jgi:hypothetical protein
MTATELELLELFGVEPELKWLEEDLGWMYNDAVYRFSIQDFQLTVALSPATRDIRIIVKRGDQHVYEFQSLGVQDVRVIQTKDTSALEVILDTHSTLRMQVFPSFEVWHGYDVYSR